MGDDPPPQADRGLLDTNILILWDRIERSQLPEQVAISSITLAELSAGVHTVSVEADEQERAQRIELVQRAENAFDPLPFDAVAARTFGRVTAAVRALGRSHRSRMADLMIASVAAARSLPLYTTNPADFAGLDGLTTIVPVNRPHP